ncbi:hypothetical protein FHU26_000005 [Clostridium beijerinckii]|nr:hypothetical protein [Clostridium beijerinckii]
MLITDYIKEFSYSNTNNDIGSKTFFLKDLGWASSSVTRSRSAVVIQQFPYPPNGLPFYLLEVQELEKSFFSTKV